MCAVRRRRVRRDADQAQPVAAPHIEMDERVYEYGNFADLGIGG